jgi:hypothetical protein
MHTTDRLHRHSIGCLLLAAANKVSLKDQQHVGMTGTGAYHQNCLTQILFGYVGVFTLLPKKASHHLPRPRLLERQ